MIQHSPRLSVRRMIVMSSATVVYDEVFHAGSNIIRGSNSSGKSTVSDFLFFGLGGDVSKWKPEAARCDRLFLEVVINGNVVTLQRAITSTPRQPMLICWGPLDDARRSAVEGWEVYSFQRSESKESFSQALFRALGMPEVRAELSNITMHQILRLIYVDQLSSVESLLRDERFDSGLNREIIGDLLLGTYDDSIYVAELTLKDRQRDLEDTTRQRDGVRDLFAEAEQEVDGAALQAQIAEAEAQLVRVRSALAKGDGPIEDRSRDAEIKDIQREVLASRQALYELQARIQNVELEIEDSKLFVVALSNRMRALDESRAVRSSLTSIPLAQCPNCLAALRPAATGACVLCKEALASQPDNPSVLRKKQELAHQIKESESLLAKRITSLAEAKRDLPERENRVKSAQRKLDDLSSIARSTRDSRVDDLLIQRGALESRLIYLAQQARAADIFSRLTERIAGLRSEIARLEGFLRDRRSRQDSRREQATARIEHYALMLLRHDLPREDFFQSATAVEVDFSKNTFAVNGRNQFSASSIIYLKNCVHFAIFFASLELPFMRYPRFILCDNMEDKGMEEARSRNFQKQVVALSQGSDVEHQIVFTTSMIDPSLNTPGLCVGREYSPASKSLKFS